MTRWAYYPKKAKDLPYLDRIAIENGEEIEKPAKYHSHKVEVDGITFDSKKEARRYEELKTLQNLGEISDLELQKKFVLIPTQREPDTKGPRGGVRKGKVVEKEVAYYADFFYHDNKTDENVVEDTKSKMTKSLSTYILKRKMMLYFHGIKIKEI